MKKIDINNKSTDTKVGNLPPSLIHGDKNIGSTVKSNIFDLISGKISGMKDGRRTNTGTTQKKFNINGGYDTEETGDSGIITIN